MSTGVSASFFVTTGAGSICLSGRDLYLAKLNEEGHVPFDHRMAQRFRDLVASRFGGGKTVGYQFGLMQSGKIIMLHGEGFADRAAGAAMTTRTRQSVASVSKMITTVSMLKLIEDGELDWNDRVIDHLPVASSTPHADLFHLRSGSPIHPSVVDVRISELLTYTARFGDYDTGNVLSRPRGVSGCDGNTLDESWSPDPRFRCDRTYQNSAFGIAGYTIAGKAGLSLVDGDEDPEAFDEYLEELWMRDANAAGMVCGAHTGTGYYAACSSGVGCLDGYREIASPGGSRSCSSGNWVMSTEDALQLMAAIRYGRVLDDASTARLFSQQQRRGGGAMAVGWDGFAAIDGGLRFTKNGGSDGVKAQVMHFPRGVDAVLFTNTSPCNGCGAVGDTLEDGYRAAIAP